MQWAEVWQEPGQQALSVLLQIWRAATSMAVWNSSPARGLGVEARALYSDDSGLEC